MKRLALLLAVCLTLTALCVPVCAEMPMSNDSGLEFDNPANEGEFPAEPEGELELSFDGQGQDSAPQMQIDETEIDLQVAVNGEWIASEQESEAAAPAGEANAPHTDPDGPQLASNELTLGVGERFDLAPAMPEGREMEISCSSADASIASITSKGTVEAVAVGDTVVTATAADGAYAECLVHVRKAPDRVKFSAENFTLGVGETTDALKAIVGSAEGEYAGACTFKSSKPKIVKVDEKGALTGVKKGTATITARTYNDKTATCEVTVLSAPDSIEISAGKTAIGVGESLSVQCKLPKNTASQVVLSSSDTGIVGVNSQTGAIVGVAPGSARVTATTFNGKSSSVDISVSPAPQALTFPVDSVRLGVGMKLPFEASVDSGAAASIKYTVKKKTIAKYSGGKLTGVKKGSTTLTAKTYNGLKATCKVTVVDAPESVKLPYDTLDIGVGESIQLYPDVGSSASTFTYASSNKKAVKVSSDGVLTGVKKGNATVTIKTYNKKTFKLKVNVKSESSPLTITPESAELSVGETLLLSCAYASGPAGSIQYSSSDEGVASVDAKSGLVTGVSVGKAVITAAAQNGNKVQATITVLRTPEWVTPESNLMELAVKQSKQIVYTFSPDSRAKLTFTSSKPKVATVSADGVVTGVKAGQAVISAQSDVPDIGFEVSVTVKPAPKSVSLKQTELTLNVGESTRMEPVIDEGAYTEFSFASSDPNVAEVDDTGLVLAVAEGQATLTVQTHNGKKATLKLTVVDPSHPDSVSLKNAPDYMKAGTTLQLEFKVKPAGANPALRWTTSNQSIAYVDEDNVLHAVNYGFATLSASSAKNSEIHLEFTLGVETDKVVLVIPERTTKISGIQDNLEKIDAIRRAAINQINALQDSGAITSSDASKRKSIVNNGFKDYAFPWMTLKKQVYWKKENSEGGAKDFKPDRVYYGIPYISGSGKNREYNAEKELRENRFKDSGKGYYILNQDNLLKGKYCGNDCSCFVDAAIWGTNNDHSNDRTSEIAKTSAYRTISGFDKLRPGDLICWGGHHVVMFLYYVNPEKNKLMIIENGGTEAGTNTVHCIIMPLAYYTSNGYKVRRLASLG